MQHKDGLLEALVPAIEEMQRACMFLAIAQALTDLEPNVDHWPRADWVSLLIQQALLVNENAVDLIHVWPDRLASSDRPLYYTE